MPKQPATVKNAPLNNADARKAISYAIDRDAIIAGVFSGFQTKATSIIPPRVPPSPSR